MRLVIEKSDIRHGVWNMERLAMSGWRFGCIGVKVLGYESRTLYAKRDTI